ncbi:MAG: NAD(P)-dependent oxidoreductase [Isosphaeraceae bacterium]
MRAWSSYTNALGPSSPDPHWAARRGVAYTDLRTFSRGSDVVTLHMPLTPETRYGVRQETLDLDFVSSL